MGYAGNDNKIDYGNQYTVPGNRFTGCGPFGCGRDNSVLGGGQLGYNLQSGSLVYGIVADASAMRLRNTSSIFFGSNSFNPLVDRIAPFGTVLSDTAYLSTRQSSLYTVRGRLGYALGSVMLYATGGLAISEIDINTKEVLNPGLPSTCTVGSLNCRVGTTSKTVTGYTFGGGAEWALDDRWSVGAEYLYANLGTKKLALPNVNPGFARYPASVTSIKMEDHVGRVTLNYRFNWW